MNSTQVQNKAGENPPPPVLNKDENKDQNQAEKPKADKLVELRALEDVRWDEDQMVDGKKTSVSRIARRSEKFFVSKEIAKLLLRKRHGYIDGDGERGANAKHSQYPVVELVNDL